MIQNDSAYAVSIFLAGDVDDIKRLCAHWCLDVGCCVTVTETEFIYTGGREQGAIIGMINYPKFPKSKEEIWNRAIELGDYLRQHTAQHSVLIQDHVHVEWTTLRK